MCVTRMGAEQTRVLLYRMGQGPVMLWTWESMWTCQHAFDEISIWRTPHNLVMNHIAQQVESGTRDGETGSDKASYLIR